MASWRHSIRASLVLAFCAIGAACASVPKVDQNLDEIPRLQAPAQIMGALGPLTPRQSKALLDKIGAEAGDAGMLKRHVAIEEAVAESPLVAGNQTRLLADGESTFPAMFRAIKSAKDHINLEYYILEDIENDGERLSDLLIAKRQEGVAVNIIFDSFGSDSTQMGFFKRLKDGGINLSTTYQSSSLGKSAGIKGKPDARWRDTDMEIDGPVVAQFQTLFLDHWNGQKGAPLDTRNF